MPSGGTLTIATGPAELTEEDRLTNFDIVPGRYAELAVSDTGTGMSAEVLPQPVAPQPRNGDTPASAILVVDDEPTILASATRMLRKHGYTVYTAGSGDQALTVVQQHDIQLLLTDTIMPDITGPALARRVNQMKPGIPVLHMSGYTANLLPGAENDLDFIQKPLPASNLPTRCRPS